MSQQALLMEDVLGFWFGGPAATDTEAAQRQSELWWGASPATDREIASRFGHLYQKAVAGDLEQWVHGPRGRLALIVLVDQFSRNIHRGRPQAFANDPQAQRWCKEGLDRGIDRALRKLERVFFYLPLEHSENINDQERSVQLFEELLLEASDTDRALYEDYLGYAVRHRDIIRRFGRFPHRNAILRLRSTKDEVAYLEEPGSGF